MYTFFSTMWHSLVSSVCFQNIHGFSQKFAFCITDCSYYPVIPRALCKLSLTNLCALWFLNCHWLTLFILGPYIDRREYNINVILQYNQIHWKQINPTTYLARFKLLYSKSKPTLMNFAHFSYLKLCVRTDLLCAVREQRSRSPLETDYNNDVRTGVQCD